ncbi:MAG TPA: hypothetical protein VNW71_17015 [Thermoanaerobaculia bacterium]|nr:hypothetical protein [Thermoanaerobaculia bacterium]
MADPVVTVREKPTFIAYDIECDYKDIAVVGIEAAGGACSYYTKVYIKLAVNGSTNEIQALRDALQRATIYLTHPRLPVRVCSWKPWTACPRPC